MTTMRTLTDAERRLALVQCSFCKREKRAAGELARAEGDGTHTICRSCALLALAALHGDSRNGRCITERDHAIRDSLWEFRDDIFQALSERARPDLIAKMTESIGTGEDRLTGGAPLTPSEQELVARLRKRGQFELASMVMVCFGEGRGDTEKALEELGAP